MFFYQNQEEGSRGFANNQFKNSKKHSSTHSQTHQATKLESYHAIRFKQYQTVTLTNDGKYYQETDQNFVTDVRAIARLNRNFILHLLKDRKEVKLDDNQCEELHHEATIHREANIVNTNTQIHFQKANEVYRCLCGCQKASGDLLPICCDLSSLKVLGEGVNLFFIFEKGIIINLLIAAIMFGIYTTLANLSGGNGPSTVDQCNVSDSKCNFVNNSSASNNVNDHLIKIEYLLGLILCIIWGFTMRLIRKFGHDKSKEIEKDSKTSSDTAIQVTNLPFGQYCESDLKKYFESLYQNEDTKWKKQNKFTAEETNYGIKSIQIVYNMQFCRELIKKIQQGCSEAAKLLIAKKSRDNLIPLDDYQKYKLCKTSIIQTYEIMNDLRKKFLNDEKFRKKISTTYCIIMFSKEQHAKAVTDKYGKDKIGFLKRIQYKLMKCCFPKTKNITFRGKVLVIERAPEPSDIIWLNCQKQYSTCRIFGILLITVTIIIISFGLLLGLQYVNNYYSNGGSSQVISLITTIALQVINKVLWIVLYFLLDSQYNYTMTEKIVSQMNKAMLAICFNVLVLPFIVYVSFKNQLYGSKGLTGFVFDYHITVITAGLALKFFNPVDLIIRLGIYIQKIRNTIFRFLRKDYDSNENDRFKKRIHTLYEGEYFDVAEAYIFIMTNVFHATFFCHLCPPILFFALAEVFIYYWIVKVKLVRQFMIPESTELLVFDNALTLAYLVPIVYGMGSFFVSYKQSLSSQAYFLNYVFQMIVIGMGVISYINPGDIFNILTKKMLACLTCQDSDNKDVQNKKKEDKFEGSNIAFHNGPLQQQESEVQTVKKTIDKCKVQEDNNREQQPNAKVERSQSYYRNSNSLQLLGFQHVLKGKHESELKDELKSYCQAFLSRQQDIWCMVEDVKKIMINTLIPIQVGQNIQVQSKDDQSHKKKKTRDF